VSKSSIWDHILISYIESRKEVPFEWGKNDCITFVLHYLYLVTGIDVIETLPKWNNALSAMRAIRTLGIDLDDIFRKIAVEYSVVKKPKELIQRGDIAIIKSPNGPMCTLCIGKDIVAPGEDGIIPQSKDNIISVWEIK
jgi:hypothetical protein